MYAKLRLALLAPAAAFLLVPAAAGGPASHRPALNAGLRASFDVEKGTLQLAWLPPARNLCGNQVWASYSVDGSGRVVLGGERSAFATRNCYRFNYPPSWTVTPAALTQGNLDFDRDFYVQIMFFCRELDECAGVEPFQLGRSEAVRVKVPKRCRVVSVRGLTTSQAKQQLVKNGCKTSQIQVRHRCVAHNQTPRLRIVGQDPAAGRVLGPGEKVTLYIEARRPACKAFGNGGAGVRAYDGQYQGRTKHTAHWPWGDQSGSSPFRFRVSTGKITGDDLRGRVDRSGRARGSFEFPGFKCRFSNVKLTLRGNTVHVSGRFTCQAEQGRSTADGTLKARRVSR